MGEGHHVVTSVKVQISHLASIHLADFGGEISGLVRYPAPTVVSSYMGIHEEELRYQLAE